MIWRDKNLDIIKENHVIKFSLINEIDPTFFSEFEAIVKIYKGKILGYLSVEENRVIPFFESYGGNKLHQKGVVYDAEIINN